MPATVGATRLGLTRIWPGKSLLLDIMTDDIEESPLRMTIRLLFVYNDFIFLFSRLSNNHGTETRYGDFESKCPCFLWDATDFCAIDVIHENKFEPGWERSA